MLKSSRSLFQSAAKTLLVATSVLLVTLCSCSGHPEKIVASDSANFELIAIVGTNDLHGALAPMDFKTRDVTATDYQAGGVAYLSSYLRIMREELGSRMLWLDAGDEFQGTIESNPNRGAAMVQFFDTAGVSAAAIGNHEFDFGAEAPDTDDLLSSLKHRMKEANYPFLAANITTASTGLPAEFPGSSASRIFQVGRIKVGVIGLSTVDTPKTTLPTNIRSLRFNSLHDAAVQQADLLRKGGADIVVITAHAGTFCDPHVPQGHSVRKPTDPQGECHADDEMTKLLKSLPPGAVDAVVSGHTHSIVHHWVAGVPVIQGGASGRYFNVIYLTYDLQHHKIVPDQARIEGPIPVCPKVFQNQNDCNGDRPAPKNGRGPLVTPQFHHMPIEADPAIMRLLSPTFEIANRTKNEVYGQAATLLNAARETESPLGNLFADAIRASAKTDFAFMNTGGIRANIEPGPITYGEIFRASPFNNTIVTMKVTGKQVRNLLQVAESGTRGFPPVSGLQLKLIHPDSDAPSSDLNEDDKTDAWEINRLLEVRLPDGSLLDDRKTYTIATIDFLVLGGDDMAWPMSQIPTDRFQYTGILTRDALASYIKTLTQQQGAINGPGNLLVSPENPRMIFVKKAAKKRSRRRKRRHRKTV
ncbi:MAG: 5'-nucleotidase C-terminal domain-containing protein [Oligoflexia bacterium]|nr:5'-nucleotidase C-terminal domain-containing protein [Oligoflexia bacterium]